MQLNDNAQKIYLTKGVSGTMIKRFFSTDESYNEMASQYTTADGILAIALYVLLIFVYYFIKKNLNQKQVAARIGVESGTISGYENGGSTPSAEILMKLASLYHVSIDYLFGMERQRFFTVDGLTDEQISALETVSEQFLKANAHNEKTGN